MKGVGFFKTGSTVLILTACIHMIGFFQEPVPANDKEKAMLELMTTYQMELPGAQRPMMDIVNFFSLSFAMFTALIGLINLWIVRQGLSGRVIRKMMIGNAVYWTIYLIPLYMYTFLFPQAFYTLAWFCFVMALIVSGEKEQSVKG